jgi:hypothetical protein
MNYLARDFNIGLWIVPKVKEPERRKREANILNSQTKFN